MNNRGSILLFALIFGTISFTVIGLGLASYAITENSASLKKHNRELAFQVADAGVNYYRWHLAHNPADYWDGHASTTAGPYVHDYTDAAGKVIGHYSLAIATPTLGSTITTITSTGWMDIQPNSKRKIKVRVGFPSLAQYAFLTNTDVWIGNDEVTHGRFHANGGIRYDGLADAPVTSAMATYTCQDFHGCASGGVTKDGIWGQGGPTQYWQYPVPAQDFTAITANLDKIQTNAAPAKGGLTFSSSGQQGWHLKFTSSTPGTVTAYKVLTTNCYKAKDVGDKNYSWPCIDIKTQDSGTVYNMPANGYIFVDDTLWVDGGITGYVVVGTGAGKSIIINASLRYKAKDGSNVLGLLADQNILVPHDSPDSLEVDGAILAHNGAAKRYYYPGDMKSDLLIYGSVISNQLWTWSWVSGGGAVVSGYRNTNATYDANLMFSPPPGFPVSANLQQISWEEVK